MYCIFDEYIKFVENFLINYFKILLGSEYERTLVRPFIDRYIDIRYYNKYTYVKESNFTERLNKELNNVAKEVMSENEDKTEKVKNIFALFGYVLYIDGVFKYSNLTNLIKTLFEDKNIKLFYSDLTRKETNTLIREYVDKKNSFFKIFENDEFYLKGKKIYDNLFFVDLGNNCSMSKLYSDYAVERAYNSEVVLENRIYLMLLMVTTKILSEAITLDFKNNYVFDFPESLLEKPKKILRYLKVLDNDMLRNRIHIRFKYKDYKNKKYKTEINSLINKDYSICLELDETYDIDFDNLFMFSYIFIDKSRPYYDNIINNQDEVRTTIVTL